MPLPWVDSALTSLTDFTLCPDCASPLSERRCTSCGLDLSGPTAREIAKTVAHQSRLTAQAIRDRQHVVALLRSAAIDDATMHDQALASDPRTPQAAGPLPRPATPRPGQHIPHPQPVPPPARASVGIQTVMAAAGAGLLIVAGLIFVFFSLVDNALTLQAGVVGLLLTATTVTTVALRRKGLDSSARQVAVMTIVLAATEVLLLRAPVAASVGEAWFWVISCAVASGFSLALGLTTRIRAWVTCGLFTLPVLPVVLGWAITSGSLLGLGAGLLIASLLTAIDAPAQTRFAARLGADLRGEVQALLLFRVVAFLGGAALATAMVSVGLGPLITVASRNWPLAASLLLLLASGVALRWAHRAPGIPWAVVSGTLLTMAAVLPQAGSSPTPALTSLAVMGLAVLAVRRPARDRAADGRRAAVLAGTWLALCVTAAAGAASSLAEILRIPILLPGAGLSPSASSLPDVDGAWTITSTAVLALSCLLAVAARHPSAADGPAETRSRGRSLVVRTGQTLLPWATGLLVLSASFRLRYLPVTMMGTGAAALVLAVAAIRHLARQKSIRTSWQTGWTPALATTGALALALSTASSWAATPSVVAFAPVAMGGVLALRSTIPPALDDTPGQPFPPAAAARAVLLGLAYAYGLVVVAFALHSWQVPVPTVSAVSIVASLCALIVTLLARIGPRSWATILLVSLVPFGAGVLSVIWLRDLWAGGAGLTAGALALTVLLSRRETIGLVARAGAAALLLPIISLVLICCGAVALPGSGSPVLLPLVAILTGATALCAPRLLSVLGDAGIPSAHARAAALAMEMSTGATAAVALGLAFGRNGQDTAFLLLVIFAAFASCLALRPTRSWVWWVAGGLWVSAWWTAMDWSGAGTTEVFTLAPSVAAVVVGTVLTLQRGKRHPLVQLGLLGAVLPSLLVLCVRLLSQPTMWEAGGAQSLAAEQWRAASLVAASVLLTTVAWLVLRPRAAGKDSPLALLARPAAVSALVASCAGTVLALLLAVTGRSGPTGSSTFVSVVLLSLLSSVVAAGAAYVLVSALRRTASPSVLPVLLRWRAAPAVLLAVVGPVSALPTKAPGANWVFWVAEILLLALLLVSVRSGLRRTAPLPPAWFLWFAALTCAIAGWSSRELRVEAFSLPLGLGLLAAGALVFRQQHAAGAGIPAGSGDHFLTPQSRAAQAPSWPFTAMTSNRLLAPGILATLGPSVLSTYTDPMTVRAILVIVMALTLVLIGAARRIRAPFVLGIAVLPVEILVVFAARLGTAIDAGLWWMTLATAGAVLLVIAVASERSAGAETSAGSESSGLGRLTVRDMR